MELAQRLTMRRVVNAYKKIGCPIIHSCFVGIRDVYDEAKNEYNVTPCYCPAAVVAVAEYSIDLDMWAEQVNIISKALAVDTGYLMAFTAGFDDPKIPGYRGLKLSEIEKLGVADGRACRMLLQPDGPTYCFKLPTEEHLLALEAEYGQEHPQDSK